MTDVRVEEDLIGTRDVPADAYYGIHTVRALENFSFSETSIGDLDTFIPAFVMVKKAAALTNAELGAIPADVADDIVKACDLILNEQRCLDQFPVDVYQGGAGTSSNMNVNEVIANLALEVRGEPKGSYNIISPFNHVNASQSTNDTYPTALRLAVYLAVEKQREELGRLAVALELKAEEFAHIITMGRTQLQDAVPITMGQQFAAFTTLVREEIRNLHDQTRLLLEVNLGATAIGTAINTPVGYQDLAVQRLATITELPLKVADDLVEATSDTGAYVSVHSGFKRVAIKLGKICNDLRLLSSGPRAGLGEINLPQRQAGSSIMPAKVNPVIPEVVNQVCFKVRGNDLTVEAAADAGQLQLNVMEPVIAQCVFESTTLLQHAAATLRELCVDGITVNEDVCTDYVMRSIGLVTFLNPVIGHHYGDLVGKKCAESGKTVREVVLEMGLMDEASIDAVLSPENLTAPHINRPRLPGKP